MKHEHENARRHAYNTLAEVNRHLDKGNIRNPKHHYMLTDMAEKATRTLENIDRLESKRPYSDTNIGYGADTKRSYRTSDEVNDAINETMNAINRILPRISDDFEWDMEQPYNRQGVPGTGPYANPRLRRRGGRKGIGRRRYDLDDMDYADMDDYNAYDAYDAYNDEMEARRGGRRRRDSRGRFVRSDYDRYDDARYDDMRYDKYDRYNTKDRADHERQTHDTVARVAAETAADTARRMASDRNDARNIYPGTPVMVHHDTQSNARNDGRYDTQNDTRYDARNETRSDRRYEARYDTNNDTHRPGPDMKR